MSNKKSVDDKQLIRAIADVVVNTPHIARDVFSSTNDVTVIFPELIKMSKFVLSFTSSEQYYEKLEDEIANINDNETRAIFKSALSSHSSSKNKKFV